MVLWLFCNCHGWQTAFSLMAHWSIWLCGSCTRGFACVWPDSDSPTVDQVCRYFQHLTKMAGCLFICGKLECMVLPAAPSNSPEHWSCRVQCTGVDGAAPWEGREDSGSGSWHDQMGTEVSGGEHHAAVCNGCSCHSSNPEVRLCIPSCFTLTTRIRYIKGFILDISFPPLHLEIQPAGSQGTRGFIHPCSWISHQFILLHGCLKWPVPPWNGRNDR